MTEQWREIEGFENYGVSDLGRVRRIVGLSFHEQKPKPPKKDRKPTD